MKPMFTLIAGLMAVGSAQAQACTPAHTFETVEPGYLTQAVVTYMPYSALDTEGNPIGVEGEIIKKIAEMECLKVKAVPVDSAASMNYVIGKRADLTTGGYYRTAARAKVLALSDPLYLDQLAIVSKDGLADFDILGGKSVGTVQGDLWVADLKSVYGGDLKLYPKLPQLQQDMEAGRLDAMIVSYSVFVTLQQAGKLEGFKAVVPHPDTRIGASVESGQGMVPMNLANTALVEAINADIAELHKSGFIAETLVKFGLPGEAANTGAPRLLN